MKQANLLRILLMVASIGMFGFAGANASTILSNPDDSRSGGRQLADYNIGYSFTVGSSNLYVSKLGYFDSTKTGLEHSHDVGIYLPSGTPGSSGYSGTLLESTTVVSGNTDPILDGFRYASLATPLVLTAGTTYVIDATTADGVDRFGDTNTGDSVTFSSDANAYTEFYASGSNLTFPDTQNQFPNKAYFGPNFQYTTSPLPEPAFLGLMSVASLGLLARRRRA